MKKLILLIIFSFLFTVPAKTENLLNNFKTEFSLSNYLEQPKDKKPKKKKNKRSKTKNVCGTERWDVKTLTDEDAKKIDYKNIIEVTVEDLTKNPKKYSTTGSKRTSIEMNVYRVTGILKEYKIESNDHDYHIVLEDQYSNKSIVIEILDPECPEVKNSSMYFQFKKIRDEFTNEYKPTTKFKKSGHIVTVTGVGFIDFPHRQRGMSMNMRELHPVLSFHIDQR